MNAQTDRSDTALSRLASPTGFLLVLLLFLLLPFLSVSCEVPGVGSIGADYSGGQLAVGAEPEVEVPPDLADMAGELPGGDGQEPPPDPGVQVLAIVTGLVLLAGIVVPLLPRPRGRARSYLAVGTALLAAAAVLVTQLVARSNLATELRADAENLSDGEQAAMPDVDQIVDEMIHAEIGFWLSLFGLMLIALVNVGLLIRDLMLRRPGRTAGEATDTPVAGFFRDDDPPDDRDER
ncbi:hypothetical protein [Actinophytocola gossypii]|uniref:Uncharacterized protein n=1 Tax=Actinophytocola gossypii TaxID=2812003 RepID=A0ABT2JC64_9PSEU|nr:hypothetical protein [Actinophytocola gossypii]MCT2585055.1 hypothetical protein [Actinophytocola gossypii]